MSFLVDANVAVYAAAVSAYREACAEIIEAITRGEAEGRMSTAIIEEIWHIEMSGKVEGIDGLARRTYVVFTPLLAVTDEIVARALELRAPKLGANDRLHVATAFASGIDTIVSVDGGFDGVPGLRRVDPLNEAGRARLLRS